MKCDYHVYFSRDHDPLLASLDYQVIRAARTPLKFSRQSSCLSYRIIAFHWFRVNWRIKLRNGDRLVFHGSLCGALCKALYAWSLQHCSNIALYYSVQQRFIYVELVGALACSKTLFGGECGTRMTLCMMINKAMFTLLSLEISRAI